jgi:hypothetical protein
VLEVADLDDERLALGVDPDGVRAESALDASHDDPVLVEDLWAAQHRLAEVIVDRGVRATRGCPSERDRRRHRARAPHQQLWARPDECRLWRPEAEAEAGRKELAKGAEQARGIVRGRRLDGELAGEDHLFDRRGADPLHSRCHDSLVPVGWIPPEYPRGGARVRVCRRQRGSAQGTETAGGAVQKVIGSATRLEIGGSRQEGPFGAADDRHFGQDGERRRQRGPDRC